MPAPGQMAPHRDNAHFAKMLEALQSKGEPDLAREVAELRKEIAALRAELAPVPSLIVTGRQALDEFKRLAPNARLSGVRLNRQFGFTGERSHNTWRTTNAEYASPD